MDFEKYKNKFDYVTQREEWRQEESRIHQQFRDDALAEVGMADHPKADKVYSLAWENGHSAGFTEVFYHLRDYAALFQD